MNSHQFVITSRAPPGVVIQPFDRLTALSGVEGLDGHGAERLAMTCSGVHCSFYAPALVAASRDDNV